MASRTQPSCRNGRYSAVAIALHWAIAALMGFNLTLGWFMEGFGAWRRLFVDLHISAGITVLALTAVRVLWRLAHSPPAVRRRSAQGNDTPLTPCTFSSTPP